MGGARRRRAAGGAPSDPLVTNLAHSSSQRLRCSTCCLRSKDSCVPKPHWSFCEAARVRGLFMAGGKGAGRRGEIFYN